MSLELFDAIERHDAARLVALLADGADPNAGHPDQPAWVPLKAAVEELSTGGGLTAVVLLLRYGAVADGGRIPGGATPLLVAALNRQAEAMRLLLAAGADPAIRDDEGDTALALCERAGDWAGAALLRLCGAAG